MTVEQFEVWKAKLKAVEGQGGGQGFILPTAPPPGPQVETPAAQLVAGLEQYERLLGLIARAILATIDEVRAGFTLPASPPPPPLTPDAQLVAGLEEYERRLRESGTCESLCRDGRAC